MVSRCCAAVLAASIAVFSAPAKTIEISGEVKQGETYSHELKGGLMFCLMPEADHGWNIMVSTACELEAPNFATSATPPYYGVHPTQLSAWHFVPGRRVLGNTREFQFVLNRKEHQAILSLLDNRPIDAGKILTLVERLGRGKGKLRVLDAELGPTSKNSKEFPQLLRLKFTATLVIPDN